jgi:ABC-type phosphate/phosphonate transport system permease subunit
MRIISVRPEPVAKILTVVYAVFGLLSWLTFAFTGADRLTIPFGFIAPLFNLNLNLHLGRTGSVLWNAFYCLVDVLCYAISGWITGAIFASAFNFVAKRMGGVEAKYFEVLEESKLTADLQHYREERDGLL